MTDVIDYFCHDSSDSLFIVITFKQEGRKLVRFFPPARVFLEFHRLSQPVFHAADANNQLFAEHCGWPSWRRTRESVSADLRRNFAFLHAD